jgi:hypothetical protein
MTCEKCFMNGNCIYQANADVCPLGVNPKKKEGRQIKKKIFVVLLFPILAILWIVGWVCFVVGKKKETQHAKSEET